MSEETSQQGGSKGGRGSLIRVMTIMYAGVRVLWVEPRKRRHRKDAG